MEVYKKQKKVKFVFVLISLLLCTACGNKELKQENEELRNKLEEIQQGTTQSIETVVRQYKDINGILVKLEKVSGRIIDVRQNIEGTRQLRTIDEIDKHIASIEKELQSARKGNNNNEFKKIIANLEKMLAEKQKEIVVLRKEVERLEGKVEAQEFVIREQDQKIQKQNQQIRTQQANQWHEMGVLLYNISKNYEDGAKGFLGINKKNAERMKRNKKQLLEEANKCFQEALKMGMNASDQYLKRINNELKNL